MPRRFWRTAKVTGVLPSWYSEIRGATVRIAKTNTILKPPVNKLCPMENTYLDTNQTDKERKPKARSTRDWRTKELIRMLTAWTYFLRGGVFEHCKY